MNIEQDIIDLLKKYSTGKPIQLPRLPIGVCPILNINDPNDTGRKGRFKIGDKVIVRSASSLNGAKVEYKGTITAVDHTVPCYELDYMHWFPEGDISIDLAEQPLAIGAHKKCICGAHKAYGQDFPFHATWCDLYVKP